MGGGEVDTSKGGVRTTRENDRGYENARNKKTKDKEKGYNGEK